MPVSTPPCFPFTAVAGQADFKLALTLAAINPATGGVLVSGPRGSAKSTLARGLSDILRNTDQQQHAFVTLPLGASEEMLLGTLNLQQVLDKQQVAFQPGLLAKANKGVLYVDEVNLLQDNLADLLLDVSASGINIVERDGISHSHPAQFILLGTMNPDEGELRPQLQDRFGLSVELSNQYSIAERVEIVQLRESFEVNPQLFLSHYSEQQQALCHKITCARQLLTTISCPLELRTVIAERCHQAAVDGVRADIAWFRAAIAHAALYQRSEVILDDINAVEGLVLAHRRQQNTKKPHASPPPFSRPPSSEVSGQTPPSSPTESHSTEPPQSSSGDWGSMPPQQQNTTSSADLSLPSKKKTPQISQALLCFQNKKADNAAATEKVI